MISFSNINKSFHAGFKHYPVLFDISLKVKEGEIFGFLGPNGAGKSTSIKLLLGFLRPDSGKIFINDLQVGKDTIQNHIGYLPEIPCFYENLTGLETLLFAGRSSGIKGVSLKNNAIHILKKLDLESGKDKRIKAYSKGMKQRLGLAMTLIHDPGIFILDEPMSGLDPLGRRLITDVILELKERGKTVFFSSHILSDIEKLCDGIGILNKGRLLYDGSVSGLMDSNSHISSIEDSFMRIIGNDKNANTL